MRRRADQPRWHGYVRRTGVPMLVALLTVYCVTPYVGFIAKDAVGPIVMLRPGALGFGMLTARAAIQDIPTTQYVGLYQPTVPVIWNLLIRDDHNGWRIYVPYWLPIAVLLGMMSWVAYCEWDRGRAAGSCTVCGYSLAGCVMEECACCGVTAVACPECGAKNPQPAASAPYPEDDDASDAGGGLSPSGRTLPRR